MKLTDRVLEFLGNWTEERFAHSCAEMVDALGEPADAVQAALTALENAHQLESVEHEGERYYASMQARVERALVDLVQQGKVIVADGADGILRYRAAPTLARSPGKEK